jgi:hypothetical protein
VRRRPAYVSANVRRKRCSIARRARRGSPDDPVGEAEIIRKFEANVGAALPDAAAEELRRLVMQLETSANTAELTALLRVAAGNRR